MTESLHRRHGKDNLLKRLSLVQLIVWVLSFLTAYMILFANPPKNSVFYLWHKKRLGSDFDSFLTQSSIFFMIAVFIFSIAGLAINRLRHKRKTDHYRISLFVLGILSLAGIILHLIFA